MLWPDEKHVRYAAIRKRMTSAEGKRMRCIRGAYTAHQSMRAEGLVPTNGERLLYCEGMGEELFHLVCQRDLEGVVAKRKVDPYLPSASWLKMRNRKYSRQYGLPLKGAFGKLFWQGVVWGLAFMSIEIFAIHALHGFSFGSLAIVGFELVRYAMAWAVGFVLVGIFEEFTFRGYAQFVLSEGIGFWPAAFLLSASFGAVHLQNPGEDWVGALSVTVFGLFACFTLRRTGSLWFAVGFHAAGDFAETFLYSVPDSGMLAKGHLLNSNFHGPRWLTGGTIGPEGSVFGFLLFLVAFVIFAWLYPPVKSENPLIEPAPEPA